MGFIHCLSINTGFILEAANAQKDTLMWFSCLVSISSVARPGVCEMFQVYKNPC